jgi:putative endonuclease
MWYVYILQSKKDKNLYIGISNDLKKRFLAHNNGKVTSTKNRIPFKLIYYEAYLDQNDAAQKERFLKTGWGKNYLRRSLRNYFLSKKLGG